MSGKIDCKRLEDDFYDTEFFRLANGLEAMTYCNSCEVYHRPGTHVDICVYCNENGQTARLKHHAGAQCCEVCDKPIPADIYDAHRTGDCPGPPGDIYAAEEKSQSNKQSNHDEATSTKEPAPKVVADPRSRYTKCKACGEQYPKTRTDHKCYQCPLCGFPHNRREGCDLGCHNCDMRHGIRRLCKDGAEHSKKDFGQDTDEGRAAGLQERWDNWILAKVEEACRGVDDARGAMENAKNADEEAAREVRNAFDKLKEVGEEAENARLSLDEAYKSGNHREIQKASGDDQQARLKAEEADERYQEASRVAKGAAAYRDQAARTLEDEEARAERVEDAIDERYEERGEFEEPPEGGFKFEEKSGSESEVSEDETAGTPDMTSFAKPIDRQPPPYVNPTKVPQGPGATSTATGKPLQKQQDSSLDYSPARCIPPTSLSATNTAGGAHVSSPHPNLLHPPSQPSSPIFGQTGRPDFIFTTATSRQPPVPSPFAFSFAGTAQNGYGHDNHIRNSGIAPSVIPGGQQGSGLFARTNSTSGQASLSGTTESPVRPNPQQPNIFALGFPAKTFTPAPASGGIFQGTAQFAGQTNIGPTVGANASAQPLPQTEEAGDAEMMDGEYENSGADPEQTQQFQETGDTDMTTDESHLAGGNSEDRQQIRTDEDVDMGDDLQPSQPQQPVSEYDSAQNRGQYLKNSFNQSQTLAQLGTQFNAPQISGQHESNATYQMQTSVDPASEDNFMKFSGQYATNQPNTSGYGQEAFDSNAAQGHTDHQSATHHQQESYTLAGSGQNNMQHEYRQGAMFQNTETGPGVGAGNHFAGSNEMNHMGGPTYEPNESGNGFVSGIQDPQGDVDQLSHQPAWATGDNNANVDQPLIPAPEGDSLYAQFERLRLQENEKRANTAQTMQPHIQPSRQILAQGGEVQVISAEIKNIVKLFDMTNPQDSGQQGDASAFIQNPQPQKTKEHEHYRDFKTSSANAFVELDLPNVANKERKPPDGKRDGNGISTGPDTPEVHQILVGKEPGELDHAQGKLLRSKKVAHTNGSDDESDSPPASPPFPNSPQEKKPPFPPDPMISVSPRPSEPSQTSVKVRSPAALPPHAPLIFASPPKVPYTTPELPRKITSPPVSPARAPSPLSTLPGKATSPPAVSSKGPISPQPSRHDSPPPASPPETTPTPFMAPAPPTPPRPVPGAYPSSQTPPWSSQLKKSPKQTYQHAVKVPVSPPRKVPSPKPVSPTIRPSDTASVDVVPESPKKIWSSKGSPPKSPSKGPSVPGASVPALPLYISPQVIDPQNGRNTSVSGGDGETTAPTQPLQGPKLIHMYGLGTLKKPTGLGNSFFTRPVKRGPANERPKPAGIGSLNSGSGSDTSVTFDSPPPVNTGNGPRNNVNGNEHDKFTGAQERIGNAKEPEILPPTTYLKPTENVQDDARVLVKPESKLEPGPSISPPGTSDGAIQVDFEPENDESEDEAAGEDLRAQQQREPSGSDNKDQSTNQIPSVVDEKEKLKGDEMKPGNRAEEGDTQKVDLRHLEDTNSGPHPTPPVEVTPQLPQISTTIASPSPSPSPSPDPDQKNPPPSRRKLSQRQRTPRDMTPLTVRKPRGRSRDRANDPRDDPKADLSHKTFNSHSSSPRDPTPSAKPSPAEPITGSPHPSRGPSPAYDSPSPGGSPHPDNFSPPSTLHSDDGASPTDDPPLPPDDPPPNRRRRSRPRPRSLSPPKQPREVIYGAIFIACLIFVGLTARWWESARSSVPNETPVTIFSPMPSTTSDSNAFFNERFQMLSIGLKGNDENAKVRSEKVEGKIDRFQIAVDRIRASQEDYENDYEAFKNEIRLALNPKLANRLPAEFVNKFQLTIVEGTNFRIASQESDIIPKALRSAEKAVRNTVNMAMMAPAGSNYKSYNLAISEQMNDYHHLVRNEAWHFELYLYRLRHANKEIKENLEQLFGSLETADQRYKNRPLIALPMDEACIKLNYWFNVCRPPINKRRRRAFLDFVVPTRRTLLVADAEATKANEALESIRGSLKSMIIVRGSAGDSFAGRVDHLPQIWFDRENDMPVGMNAHQEAMFAAYHSAGQALVLTSQVQHCTTQLRYILDVMEENLTVDTAGNALNKWQTIEQRNNFWDSFEKVTNFTSQQHSRQWDELRRITEGDFEHNKKSLPLPNLEGPGAIESNSAKVTVSSASMVKSSGSTASPVLTATSSSSQSKAAQPTASSKLASTTLSSERAAAVPTSSSTLMSTVEPITHDTIKPSETLSSDTAGIGAAGAPDEEFPDPTDPTSESNH